MTKLFSTFALYEAQNTTQEKWTVRLVIADGHFNRPLWFLWVCMGEHTVITLKDIVGFKRIQLIAENSFKNAQRVDNPQFSIKKKPQHTYRYFSKLYNNQQNN